jgi:hypothetical protein
MLVPTVLRRSVGRPCAASPACSLGRARRIAIWRVSLNLGLEHSLPWMTTFHRHPKTRRSCAGGRTCAASGRFRPSIERFPVEPLHYFMSSSFTRGFQGPAVQNCTLSESIFAFIASAPVLSMLERGNRLERSNSTGNGQNLGFTLPSPVLPTLSHLHCEHY